MADDKTGPDREYVDRIASAFDALGRKVGNQLDERSRKSLEDLRSAASDRDVSRLRDGLTAVQERHGWLYRELAEHPEISTLLNELALWGF